MAAGRGGREKVCEGYEPAGEVVIVIYTSRTVDV